MRSILTIISLETSIQNLLVYGPGVRLANGFGNPQNKSFFEKRKCLFLVFSFAKFRVFSKQGFYYHDFDRSKLSNKLEVEK